MSESAGQHSGWLLDTEVRGEGEVQVDLGVVVSCNDNSDIYRVIFLTRPGVRACKSAILWSFKLFLYILHSKIWAHFHFGTFEPQE